MSTFLPKKIGIIFSLFLIFTGSSCSLFNVFSGAVEEELLRNACIVGDFESVTYYLDSGVSPEARDGWNSSPMYYAAGNGHIQIVKLLLERGVDIDSPTRMHKTALIVASQSGKKEVVEFLLEQGANTSLRDTEGRTAADHAEENGHKEIVKLLSK